MRRRYVISLIAAAIVVFLGISALLARALSAGGAEESAVTNLVRAEARGDVNGVVGLVKGCRADATCRARAATNAGALRHAGTVSVIQTVPTPGFAVTGSVDTVRVAWLVGGSLPRVQCVRVHRAGNVFSGFTITLLRVSVRIPSDRVCPRTY